MSWSLIIIAGVIVVMLLVVITGSVTFRATISKEVARLMPPDKKAYPKVIRAEQLNHLPEPVQRYMRYARVVDKPEITRLLINQKGEIRTDRDQRWMPFKARQYISVTRPGFLWQANSFPILVRDMFDGNTGSMRINFLGLHNLAIAESREIDQGSLMRYLSEMVWYPSAFLQKEITWKSADYNSATAEITTGRTTVSGTFHFNTMGAIESFTARRYREIHGSYELDNWLSRVEEYREAEGYMIPFKGSISWELPEGNLDYSRYEITNYHRLA